MDTTLDINTGFAVNRMTPPQEWVPFVSEVLGIRNVQLTADLLNPGLPEKIFQRVTKETLELCDRYDVKIQSTFTGAFTRVNHFSHPDPEIREYWIDWFGKFAWLTAELGGSAMGSHFGIQTMADCKDREKTIERFQGNVDCWKRVSEKAADAGLKQLTWEPMSISREYGETIEEVERIQSVLERSDLAIPMNICLDVDHGDVASNNPDDINPYIYLRKFAKQTTQVHLKQSYQDKGGHWPFTEEHNEKGRITPEKVLEALESGGAESVSLILELSFRERTPFEVSMIDSLKQSVQYWAPYVKGGT